MKLFKSLKICFTVVLLSSPLFSLAQYKFPIKPFFSYFRDLSRYEIGGTGLISTGTFDGTTRITGYSNQFIGDSTQSRGLTSNPGFGGSIGIAVPFAAAGHISVWAVSIHAMVNFSSWYDLNVTKGLDGVYTLPATNALTAKTMQIALPIGIDYKIGCDAVATRRLRLGAAFGAGVLPHVNITTLDPAAANDLVVSQQSIGFNPYVKLEGSIYPGMCVRLRLLYTMGNVELMSTKVAMPGFNDGPFNLTTRSTIMASLLIMPFSVRWKETAWWNTRDSYNWNERRLN